MLIKVDGENKEHKIMCYTLSTCVWCKRTKQWLKDNGYEYEYIDMDYLEGAEKEKIRDEIKKFCDRISYPTVVIDDKQTIVGHHTEKLAEALKA